MKIGIVAFANIGLCPYIKFYTRYFDERRMAYEVVYWNRHGIEEDSGFPCHIFHYRLDDSAPLPVKFARMVKYARFVDRTAYEQEYDFLIVLTTVLAVFMSRTLINRYHNRFVLDIRDYSYEHISLYKRILSRLMRSSSLNLVSSPGFSQVLPSDDVHLCHNIDPEVMTDHSCRSIHSVEIEQPIVIGFVGLVRYAEAFKWFVDRIGNDPRFEFRVYGTGIDEAVLREFCVDRGITNVRFFGRYKPEDKGQIYNEVDLIFNGYGNRSNQVRLALSNKLYDAAWYGKPILVSEGTSMEDCARGICFVLRENDVLLVDNLYSWYSNMDWESFSHRCSEILQTALSDNARAYAHLDAVLREMR